MVEKNVATNKMPNLILILIGVSSALILLDILFISLVKGEANTISLLNKELVGLQQNEKIISSASDIYASYQNEIELISQTFPTEETIPQFVQYMENLIRNNSSEYNLKFNAVTPIQENDYLFLPLSIIMKTDMTKLANFYDALEKSAYITHINSVSIKTPDGISGGVEVVMGLKLYVHNPFSEK